MPAHAFGIRPDAGDQLERADRLENRHPAAVQRAAAQAAGDPQQFRFQGK